MIERLLRSHFVRRFLDNDLISPDADRHELIATVSGALIVLGLFISVLMGGHYLSLPFQSPGRTAVPALDNRFFLFGCSMAVMALAALASWNALSLDARDIAILGTLPIERRTMVRAKLAAVATVASALAVALNGVTSVLFPILLVGKLPIGFPSTGQLVLAHVGVSFAASLFGFLAVLAVREVLHAILGTALFTRVSIPLHACLTVAVIASLLLLPGMSLNVARTWLVDPSAPRWSVPPLWFVGLHEYLVGDIMAALPHGELPRFVIGIENRLAALYALSRPAFGGLARLAIVALAGVAAPGLAAYWWNNRRIDGAPPAPRRAKRSRANRLTARVVDRLIVRRPVGQAGFWLAWQAVTRSLPHRMSMAAAAAFGVAALTVGLPFAGGASVAPPISLAVFVPQIVALLALVLGFRHALAVPASLRANWIIWMTWLGETEHYVAGVRRCALFGVILPVAAILVPVHAMFIGVRLAAAQAMLGALVAAVFLQGLLAGFDRLALAAPYMPSGTLKTRGPVYLFGGIWVVSTIAWLIREAVKSWSGIGAFAAVAVTIYISLGFVARRGIRARGPVEFADLPDENTQRLGLTG